MLNTDESPSNKLGMEPSSNKAHGIRLEVVKLAEAKKGFVLLTKRRVVERSFGWSARFKRLASTLAGMHWLAFATLMLSSLFGKS